MRPPRLAALNSPVWDFYGCNFTERNMGRADKDGFSKEGAGRVALFRWGPALWACFCCPCDYAVWVATASSV
jgi:hypothetical protein